MAVSPYNLQKSSSKGDATQRCKEANEDEKSKTLGKQLSFHDVSSIGEIN